MKKKKLVMQVKHAVASEAVHVLQLVSQFRHVVPDVYVGVGVKLQLS